jgi:4-aminobutyrate aminotransferase-like enzyme/Ser/Thr protein kinase RdoA (MazF antagonist)
MRDVVEIHETGAFDAILASRPPGFSEEDAIRIAARTFGVASVTARNLGSERDQTFLLTGSSGESLAIMKISNAAEDSATLDMEALGVLHARRADPTIPVALPWVVPGADPGVAGAAAYRASVDGADGSHFVRLYDVLTGRGRSDPLGLSDGAIVAWGEMTARLARALRGFFHPKAQRTMLWDIQHAPRTRAMLGDIRDPGQRAVVEQVLDRFDAVVVPVWATLRAQVVHSDFTIDNALVDDDGRITGIVDFGDMSYSAMAIDLASVIDSLASGRDPEDLFRVSRLVLDGYQGVTPLEPAELAIMGELIAARSAVTIAISSWRAARGLEDAGFAERYNDSAEAIVRAFLATGWDETARRLGGARRPAPDAELIARRARVLGPALEPLTYEHPIHLVSARGVWMTDTEGRRYLDAYNNVPCVGHSHPRVTEATARQARLLNTNMRYLHGAAIELAERLVATCPDGLDTVLFVNSGSEANDLAWRMATTFTGNAGGLCTARAYHGISEAIAPLSPESWCAGRPPVHVETWAAPDTYRGTNGDPSVFAAAIERLRARGIAPAAAILDGVLSSDGFHDLDPGYVGELVRLTHEGGGLWIADEVQGGHGRTGDGMWSFQRFGIQPDFVTLGKPMGNGHPIAAVITRREIAQRFATETVFFSTFGGNPVSAAAGLAVLDVLDDERVLPRVQAAGAALRAGIRDVAGRHPAIGDVRGMGLAIGIEIVRDRGTKEPDPETTKAIKEGMRDRGVLVGTTGAAGNILKVRPPLAFTTAEVPVFIEALGGALSGREASSTRQP